MTPHIANIRMRPRKRLREEATRKDKLSEEEECTNGKDHCNSEDEFDIPYAIRDDQNRSLQLSCVLSQTKKEPLRPGDVIVYPPPLGISGYSEHRIGQVLTTEAPYTVTLDNGDVLLSAEIVVRRLMEYRRQQWFPHDGISRPLGQFRIRSNDDAHNVPRLSPELRKRLEQRLPSQNSKSIRVEQNHYHTSNSSNEDDSNDDGDSSSSSSSSSASSSELSTLLKTAMDSASKYRRIMHAAEDGTPTESLPVPKSPPPPPPPFRLSLSKQNQGSAKVPITSVTSRKNSSYIGRPPLQHYTGDEDVYDIRRPISERTVLSPLPKYLPSDCETPHVPSRTIQILCAANPKNEIPPTCTGDDDDDDILRSPTGQQTAIPPSHRAAY
jgi:hypothetical protein